MIRQQSKDEAAREDFDSVPSSLQDERKLDDKRRMTATLILRKWQTMKEQLHDAYQEVQILQNERNIQRDTIAALQLQNRQLIEAAAELMRVHVAMQPHVPAA